MEASSVEKDARRPRRFDLTLAGYILVTGIVLSSVHAGVQHFFGSVAAAIAAGITAAIFGARPIYRETESVLGTIVTTTLAGLLIGTFALFVL